MMAQVIMMARMVSPGSIRPEREREKGEATVLLRQVNLQLTDPLSPRLNESPVCKLNTGRGGVLIPPGPGRADSGTATSRNFRKLTKLPVAGSLWHQPEEKHPLPQSLKVPLPLRLTPPHSPALS
jgi:hypothetical protein